MVRLQNQEREVMQSELSYTHAVDRQLPALMLSVRSRLKRQKMALEATQKLVEELRAAVKADSAQMDIDDEPPPAEISRGRGGRPRR